MPLFVKTVVDFVYSRHDILKIRGLSILYVKWHETRATRNYYQ